MKKVLLLSGRMGSGKNQLADYIKDIYVSRGSRVVSDLFAANLKEWSKNDFKALSSHLNSFAGLLKNEIYRLMCNRQSYGLPNDGVMDNLLNLVNKLTITDENWFEKKTDITRILLQTYGTQIFRGRVDDLFWIKQTKKRIEHTDADIVLITDVRFPNEIDHIVNSDAYDAYSIRINRKLDRAGKEHEHDSETALDYYEEFSYTIDNNSTLENLKEAAFGLVENIESLQKENECQQA